MILLKNVLIAAMFSLHVSTEINIERCVKDSVEIYCSTPKSTLCRKHEPPSQPKVSLNSSRSTSVSSYEDCMGNSRTSFSSETRNFNNNDGLVCKL